jgi:hypothetical protein
MVTNQTSRQRKEDWMIAAEDTFPEYNVSPHSMQQIQDLPQHSKAGKHTHLHGKKNDCGTFVLDGFLESLMSNRIVQTYIDEQFKHTEEHYY